MSCITCCGCLGENLGRLTENMWFMVLRFIVSSLVRTDFARINAKKDADPGSPTSQNHTHPPDPSERSKINRGWKQVGGKQGERSAHLSCLEKDR